LFHLAKYLQPPLTAAVQEFPLPEFYAAIPVPNPGAGRWR